MSVILFAYVDGSDLAEVSDRIEPELDRIVRSRSWQQAPSVVNQVASGASSTDLPDWDLGLNLPLPGGFESIRALEPDIEALVAGLEAVAKTSKRAFVLGVGLPNGVTQDLEYVPGTSSSALISKLLGYLSESGHLSA